MDLKYNINRIDVLLQDTFDDVQIKENSSSKFGKFFEISVKNQKEVKIILPYKNIDGNQIFEFLYFSNPNDENSDLIPRTTNVENIVETVMDIFSNKRFSDEYLKTN